MDNKLYNLFNFAPITEIPGDEFFINIREIVGEETVADFFKEKKAVKKLEVPLFVYSIREDMMAIAIERADITPEFEEWFNENCVK